jgi:hypothetical protein
MQDNNTSGPRVVVYLFGASVIALVAYYLKMTVNEIALWQAVLGAAIPFGALVLATVKAWPKQPKNEDTDADE